jgi:hypothetical protein
MCSRARKLHITWSCHWRMQRSWIFGAKKSYAGLPDGFIFRPKIPVWANFARLCNGRCWYILWTFGSILQQFKIFHGLLVYFVVIWYIFPVLECNTKENLATLVTYAQSHLPYQCISLNRRRPRQSVEKWAASPSLNCAESPFWGVSIWIWKRHHLPSWMLDFSWYIIPKRTKYTK